MRYTLCAVFVLFCLLVSGCARGGEKQVPTATDLPAVVITPTVPTPSKPEKEPNDDDFVRVQDYIPSVVVDLKYATNDNISGQVIYDFTDAYLRYGTVKKLIPVQATLQKQGYRLKIWDAFRPVQAQFVLWEAYPVSAYVANPNGGYSSHSKGNTLDVTLVDAKGNDVEMPTGFDSFSTKANRDYSDCTPTAEQHALILEHAMEENGFTPYYSEWWHFTDYNSYPVEQTFTPPKQ